MKFITFLFSIILITLPSRQAFAARPCFYSDSCFEWQGTSEYWNPKVANANNDARVNWNVVINGHRLPLTFDSFKSPTLVMKAHIDPKAVFHEGANHITLDLQTGTGLTGVGYSLIYHGPNKPPQTIISGKLERDFQNTINCSSFQFSLNDFDPDLAKQIENMKKEVASHRERENVITAEEQAAINEADRFEKELKEIEAKLAELNAELNALNLADFDTIEAEQLAKLVAEDASIRDIFSQAKNSIAQLRNTIQNEVQLNETRTQETQIALNSLFGVSNPGQTSMTTPWQALDSYWQVPQFKQGGGQASAASETVQSITHTSKQVLENLELALRRGDQREFLAVFSSWNKFQANSSEGFKGKSPKSGDLNALRRSQTQVLKFVRQHVDLYGFFKTAPVPIHTKKTIGEKLKRWDDKLSRDLIYEINLWPANLNPTQKHLLSVVDRFEPLLDHLNNPQMSRASTNAPTEKTREMAQSGAKIAVEDLIRAARQEDSAAADELLQEAEA